MKRKSCRGLLFTDHSLMTEPLRAPCALNSERRCGELKKPAFAVPGPASYNQTLGPGCFGVNPDSASAVILRRMTSLFCASVSLSVK